MSPAVVYSLAICTGDIEVNPGPSGDNHLIRSPGQNRNEQCDNTKIKTLWFTHLNCKRLVPHMDELRLILGSFKLIEPACTICFSNLVSFREMFQLKKVGTRSAHVRSRKDQQTV